MCVCVRPEHRTHAGRSRVTNTKSRISGGSCGKRRRCPLPPQRTLLLLRLSSPCECLREEREEPSVLLSASVRPQSRVLNDFKATASKSDLILKLTVVEERRVEEGDSYK